MKANFKRVPALDKSFAIIEMMAQASGPVSINAVVRQLGLNKSTVFNILHTLVDLRVIDREAEGRFLLGTRLYALGSAAAKKSGLIQTVHPYLVRINRETKLSAFLGIRSGRHAVIIDKVDVAYDIKISSEIGMRLPLLAGAGGKALLATLPEAEIDQLIAEARLKPYTAKTITDKNAFKAAVLRSREEGIAFDAEEYIPGIVALAVPLDTCRSDWQAAVWAVGLSQQVPEGRVEALVAFLKRCGTEINTRLAAGAGLAASANAA
jgi:DNA-binding IclR family transcriptional regulator